jgi:membrane protein YdbS with pleckstrin-like domain
MLVRGPSERVRLVSRPHGITLVPAFALAFGLAAAGTVGLLEGWPLVPAGAVAVVAGALVALQAAWRWERTRFVVTDSRLYVVEGTIRRRTTAATLSSGLHVDQSVAGRLLGYGTLVAGEVEVPFVPDPGAALRALR